MRNRELKHAIDKARRAQLDEQGGYTAVEKDARALERQIREEAEQTTTDWVDQRVIELEKRLKHIERERDELRRQITIANSRNADLITGDLRRRLKLARNRLYSTRKARDYWYSHATGRPADQGRGAARPLRSVA